MPLSTRYIVMINDALDAIPINEMADFELAAAELEKVVSGSEETPVFDPRFKDPMESIHEFFDPAYRYVELDEQTEFCELLKKHIQIRIEKLHNFTEEQKREKIAERKESVARRSDNQKKIAAFEAKRVEHERLAEKVNQDFIMMQRAFYRSFSDDYRNVFNDRRLDIIMQQMRGEQTGRDRSSIAYLIWRDFADNFSLRDFAGAAGRGILRAIFDRPEPQVPQPQRRVPIRFEQTRNIMIAIATFGCIVQVFFENVSNHMNNGSSATPAASLPNTASFEERFRENPFIFSMQMVFAALMMLEYAREQIPNVQNFLATSRDRAYAFWNEVGRANDPARLAVVEEIHDALDAAVAN